MNELLGDEPQTNDEQLNERSEDWLSLARDAYRSSTDWMDKNLRQQWEKNSALFQSRHPQGSKYYSESYSHRSKIFRPKTRAVVRRNEAAAAAAFFSTPNVASVDAVNENDPAQVASAAINQELLNYRLQKSIPWFITCVGAIQDGQVNGVVISCQEWDTAKDQPDVRLIPPENFRIDPNCDWRDPIGSSPYVVELEAVYILDVLERMESDPTWHKYSEAQLRSATKETFDSTRSQRFGNQEDPQQQKNQYNQFDTVWIHKNFVRQGGREWVWLTVGTELMLTDPIPVDEYTKLGVRPYVMGFVVIETHKPYKSGLVELTEGIQTATNDVQNQRFDNIQLAMNKRYRVRSTGNVDIQALMKSVPGGVVTMSDVNNDVKVDETPDVTASSYAEQDRLNVDFDELAGTFSQSSVQTNRQLNETVGGMSLMASGANQMTEYLIRTFSETWVEPVMRHLVKLEQAYESDEVILAIAAEKAQLYQRFRVSSISEELLKQELTVTVNVGVDATDPVKRIQKMSFGMDVVMKAAQTPNIKLAEVIDEVFGKLGYKNAGRFFNGLDGKTDPEVERLTGEIQKLQQYIESKGIEADNQIQVENAKSQNKLKEISFQKQLESNPYSVPIDPASQIMGQMSQFIEGLKEEHRMIAERFERLEYGMRGVGSAVENMRAMFNAVSSKMDARVIPHRGPDGRLIAIEREGHDIKSVVRDENGDIVTVQ